MNRRTTIAMTMTALVVATPVARAQTDPEPAPEPAPAPAPEREPEPAPEPAPAPAPAPEPAPAAEDADAYVDEDLEEGPTVEHLLHGFRLGYMYVNNYDRLIDPEDPESSLKEELGMRSPHHILIGYEVQRRMVGHSWLNVLLVGNILVSGMEQSKFYPSANVLIGFEFDESFQLGIGPNLTPHRDKSAHIVFAAGWTPRVGSFHVPVHVFYVPDVDKQHRSGITFGVNW